MLFRSLHPVGVVYLLPFSFLFFVTSVEADAVNRTIDDTFGDSVTNKTVVYAPATGVWKDATCLLTGGCLIVGDPNKCFSNTYMAATYGNPWDETSITMQFNGASDNSPQRLATLVRL